MEVIRHARRRSRSHARAQAERIAGAPPRHSREGSRKAPQYDCEEREWRRERRHAERPQPPAQPAAAKPAAPTADSTQPTPPHAPLTAPLAASFPPLE